MTKKEKFFKTNVKGFSKTTLNYSNDGKVDVYGYDLKGNPFDYRVTFHRSRKILELLTSGEWWLIDESIRQNYATNGYTTRVGLNRANKKRCSKIKESHDLILTGGKLGHELRVRLRN